MARQRLTIDDVRNLDYKDLVETVYGLLRPYESPGAETPAELDRRISKTLDELPDIYAWINQLHAWYDHWADYYYDQNRNGLEYKEHREKRDMLKTAASSAKQRYEATSRRLTQIQLHKDEANMPRGRGA